MLTTNKQSQDLHQIAGVQDLSHENAAAVSGGAVTLANGFLGIGDKRFLGGSRKSLGSFNNRTSSLRITRGAEWRFWTNQNFRGSSFTLRGNSSTRFTNLVGRLSPFENNIESAQRLR